MLLAAVVGWLDQRQQEAVARVIEENRIRRSHLSGRIRLTDEEFWRTIAGNAAPFDIESAEATCRPAHW
jgi:hypothetical protein